MVDLINTDMSLFFEFVKQIKDCIDCCNEDVSHLFAEFPSEPDDFECIANEEMAFLPFFMDFDWQYYEGTDGKPDEDGETWGEMWAFSDENMVEYYRLLNELLKTGEISKIEFKLHKSGMESYIHENILENQPYYGVGYDLIYAEKEGETDCIRVYLDYNCGFSQFILYCGIIPIFDRYKTKLQELRDAYGNQEELLEAA